MRGGSGNGVRIGSQVIHGSLGLQHGNIYRLALEVRILLPIRLMALGTLLSLSL